MAMAMIALVTLVGWLASATDIPQELAYLGKGYHIILGDPHRVGSDRDPGWRNQIVDRSYLMETATIDPDTRCSYSATNYMITGALSAQKSLKSEWQTQESIGLFKIINAAFTASGSVQEMSKDSFQFKQTFFETHARCELKTANLKAPAQGIRYNLTDDFKAMVAAIPTNQSSASKKWIIANVIEYFGTHYVEKIASGGLVGIRSWMSQESFDTLKQTAKEKHFSLDVAAKGFFWFLNDPSGSGGFTRNEDATSAFQTAIQSGDTSTFCVGCDEFVKDDAGKWASAVKDHLEPIGSDSNRLRAISELLVPWNFPEVDAALLQQKKDMVQQALEDLCDSLAGEGCTTNPKDRHDIPPRTIHEGSVVESVQWHPDGATFVSGSDDNMVRIWDAINGSCLKTLSGHTSWVNSVAYSPEGQHIVSGSLDESIKTWDATTGNCLQTLIGHTDEVSSVAYSPDGQHLVSGSKDKSIKIWDASTGNCLQTLAGHTSYVMSVAYGPDGQHLVSGSKDKSIKIWDASTGNCIQTLTGHTDEVSSVAYSPDGQHIVSGSWDVSIKIWDAATGNCLQTLTGHPFIVNSVAYSPDGQHIISGSLDESIKTWDATTGNCLQTLTGHTDSVYSVAYSPDGQHIISGSYDDSIRVWDAQALESIVV